MTISADPNAIDLDAIKAKFPLPMDIPTEVGLDLIAAVEALRLRVTELAVVLVDAQREMIAIEVTYHGRPNLPAAIHKARAVLATTPAEALERARGFEQLARDAVSDLGRYARDVGPERRMVSVRLYEKALAKLDALGKQEGP